MTTKEQDIAKLCHEILSLRDQRDELLKRSQRLVEQANETASREGDAGDALDILLGKQSDRRAFQIHDPTDGRPIIVVISKQVDYRSNVERLEVLPGVGPQIGIGEVVDPDFEVVEEDV